MQDARWPQINNCLIEILSTKQGTWARRIVITEKDIVRSECEKWGEESACARIRAQGAQTLGWLVPQLMCEVQLSHSSRAWMVVVLPAPRPSAFSFHGWAESSCTLNVAMAILLFLRLPWPQRSLKLAEQNQSWRWGGGWFLRTRQQPGEKGPLAGGSGSERTAEPWAGCVSSVSTETPILAWRLLEENLASNPTAGSTGSCRDIAAECGKSSELS